MRIRGLSRSAAVTVVAGVIAGVLAGCSAWSSDLSAREAVVYFTRDTPPDVRAAAQAACVGFPHAAAEPIATDALSRRTATDIRYRVDQASDFELGQLYTCLQHQPAVRTVETRPVSDSNNG